MQIGRLSMIAFALAAIAMLSVGAASAEGDGGGSGGSGGGYLGFGVGGRGPSAAQLFFRQYPQLNRQAATSILEKLERMDQQKLLVLSTIDTPNVCVQLSCLGIEPQRVKQLIVVALNQKEKLQQRWINILHLLISAISVIISLAGFLISIFALRRTKSKSVRNEVVVAK